MMPGLPRLSVLALGCSLLVCLLLWHLWRDADRRADEAERAALTAHDWPGNVRELEHAIHRAVVLARATQAGDEVMLEPQHFQFAVAAPALSNEPSAALGVPVTGSLNLREATESFQREAIARALAENQRNWAATARALELDVANLHRLAKRLGLKESPPDKSSAG